MCLAIISSSLVFMTLTVTKLSSMEMIEAFRLFKPGRWLPHLVGMERPVQYLQETTLVPGSVIQNVVDT